ncbi:hypothetical protein CFP56_021264 [Quercus suber]|uniref:Uncharacterized protein n=1 Tax=Quercus suber TaxID=58331 RepID=A0AAW0KHT9_QUESU
MACIMSGTYRTRLRAGLALLSPQHRTGSPTSSASLVHYAESIGNSKPEA